MTSDAITEVEHRFRELRQEYSQEQWEDAQYLLKVVESLEASDLPLAYRLMQRVRNLRQNDAELESKLDVVRHRMQAQNPNSMRASSAETPSSKPLISETKSVPYVTTKQPKQKALEWLTSPLAYFVVWPFLCFAFYQLIWASERYESQTQLIVQQPDGASTLDPSMALLAGFVGGASTSDTELVRTYIHSNDMLQHLKQTLAVDEHYADTNFDVFSRLSSDASREDLMAYFQQRVVVEIDEKSSVITVRAQGYEPTFTQQLTAAIAKRAEWYINEIGNNLANSQLAFVQREHEVVERKLEKAKVELLEFQRKYNLLNPEAEGIALQQITNSLDAQVAAKEAALRTLLNSMSETAPAVIQLKQEISGLKSQLETERERMISIDQSAPNAEVSPNGVSEILARFSEYKVNLELALQAYTASQISMEKSRIEAYRQLKYLVMVEAPTLPEEAKYPKTGYNLALFFVVLLLVFGIGKIIVATINELK